MKEHALEAFELGVADYLLKPFTQKRVNQCLQRLAQRLAGRFSAAGPSGPTRIVARNKRNLVFLDVESVWAFESADRLTLVHSGPRVVRYRFISEYRGDIPRTAIPARTPQLAGAGRARARAASRSRGSGTAGRRVRSGGADSRTHRARAVASLAQPARGNGAWHTQEVVGASKGRELFPWERGRPRPQPWRGPLGAGSPQ